jgi:hypothetical protein
LEDIEAAEAKADELDDLLKEKSYQCQQLEIQLNYHKRQAAVTENEAFRDWFRKTILLEDVDSNVRHWHATSEEEIRLTATSDDNAGDNSIETVQSLVVSLLVQWREQVGYYPRGASGAVSKAEHKFMQRISDLVLESHTRCSSAVKMAAAFKRENEQLSSQLSITTDRFENCMVYLRRCQLLYHKIACLTCARAGINAEQRPARVFC